MHCIVHCIKYLQELLERSYKKTHPMLLSTTGRSGRGVLVGCDSQVFYYGTGPMPIVITCVLYSLRHQSLCKFLYIAAGKEDAGSQVTCTSGFLSYVQQENAL